MPPCASRSGAALRCPLPVMPLRSSHRRSGEWRLPHASYWPGPARPHIQGFPASDRDCGWWFLRFRRQDGVPLLSTGYLMRDGGEDATATETAVAQLPHGVLKLAISSKVLSSVYTVPLPLLHSIPTVLLYFPRYPRVCLGSKLLVIPMTKRDTDIFLVRHRRMAQRDLARRRSVPQPPTRLLVRSSQVLQASSTRVRHSSPSFSIPMLITFSGSSLSPNFFSSGPQIEDWCFKQSILLFLLPASVAAT